MNKRTKLSPKQRECIIARAEKGDLHKDIAADFGVSKGRVGQIYRAWKAEQLDASAKLYPPSEIVELSDAALENAFVAGIDRFFSLQSKKRRIGNQITETLVSIEKSTKRLPSATPTHKRAIQNTIRVLKGEVSTLRSACETEGEILETIEQLAFIVREFVRRGKALPYF